MRAAASTARAKVKIVLVVSGFLVKTPIIDFDQVITNQILLRSNHRLTEEFGGLNEEDLLHGVGPLHINRLQHVPLLVLHNTKIDGLQGCVSTH